jgi:FixJ family two-component response regulator
MSIESTVFVVDNDISVRETLSRQIRGAGWQACCAASVEEFLAWPRTLRPCCLLVELRLPGPSGLELQQLVSDRVEMPVIFMSREADIPATVRAMKAGAIEFLTKPLAPAELFSAVAEALRISRSALSKCAQDQAFEQRLQSLSLREREVMQLVVTGRLNKQVAAQLGISEVTVKVHRGKMMRKMRAGSFADLVNMNLQLAPPLPGRCQPLLRSSAERTRGYRAPAAIQHPY